MRYAKLGGLGIVAAATLWGGTALAQEMYQPFIVNQTKLASPKLVDSQTLNFYGSETYDSNVVNTDAALAAARGLKPSDDITAVGLNAQFIQTLGLQRFFIHGDFSYNWYARNHVLDYGAASFSGGDTLTMGACQATLQGDYYLARSDEPVLLAQAISNTRGTGSIGVNAVCGHQYGFSPNVSVTERWNTNSAYVYRDANSHVFTVAGGLDYRTPALGSLGLYGEYDNVKYNQLYIVSDGSTFRDEFDMFTGGFKYSKQFDSRLSAKAYLTYTDVESNISNGPDFHGLTYSLNLDYAVLPRFSADLIVSRAAEPTYDPFATYTVAYSYIGRLSFQASSRLRFQLDGSAVDRDYRGTTTFDLLNPATYVTHQSIYRVEGTAEYGFSQRLWGDLFVGERTGDDNLPGFNYWSTFVGVRLRAAFGH